MKKILIVLFLFFLLVPTVKENHEFTIKDYVHGEYRVYTAMAVNEDSICLGTCFMTEGDVKAKGIVGESVKTSNTELAVLIDDLKAEIVKTEYLDCGAVIISAYSPKIKDELRIDGEKVNLQIATYSDYSVVGWPVILGSF